MFTIDQAMEMVQGITHKVKGDFEFLELYCGIIDMMETGGLVHRIQDRDVDCYVLMPKVFCCYFPLNLQSS